MANLQNWREEIETIVLKNTEDTIMLALDKLALDEELQNFIQSLLIEAIESVGIDEKLEKYNEGVSLMEMEEEKIMKYVDNGYSMALNKLEAKKKQLIKEIKDNE